MVVKRQIGVCRIQENHAKVCACCLSSIFVKPWSVNVGIMIYYLPQFLLSETDQVSFIISGIYYMFYMSGPKTA